MKYKILIVLILVMGLWLRLYHIEFGLPHSFYADEPEFTEPAIKYTYEILNIVRNNDYYKLIPVSFVYGTFPVYMFSVSLMVFSKSLNILDIAFDKTTMFIFLRVLTALISIKIVYLSGLLAKKHFGNVKTFALTVLLAAFNWKLIVHAHYVNADIILTLLLMLSFYWAWLYDKNATNRNLFLSAVFFGLAVGTKITALISLPLFLYLVWKKRDIYGFPGFILSSLLAFIVSNPFSIIFFKNFSFRIYEMLSKESGMVFDSVDSNPFKYLFALSAMMTFPILLAAIYGIYQKIKISREKTFDVFLLANILLYVVFFSLQSRRVDRWLLPMLPILLMYSAFGLQKLYELLRRPIFKALLVLLVTTVYLVNPITLFSQFHRWTPKSEAYLWTKANLPTLATKLVYTEEGLDPTNKLPSAKVYQFKVYESEGAHLFYPDDPLLYDYVILSSRPMENWKRQEVAQAYPNYSSAWEYFEQTVENPKLFEVIKDFTLTKPNLIPLSDVVVYKKL